ncbi:MAG: hypothetical protein LBE89_05835 [Helicobacteraceae bacterium]|jgi:translation elongation factor EF-G|nr:hypothetical protein [Helicobacteraceae bacterium]
MIAAHLQTSIETINELIKTTREDLRDIKEAKHEPLLNRVKLKEELVDSFTKTKHHLDREILHTYEANQDKPIEEILSKEEQELLSTLRVSLETLRAENKRFASMALAVGEFYTSLLSAILPGEKSGYEAVKLPKTPNFLHIKG